MIWGLIGRWLTGASAERSVGETLNTLVPEGFTVRHDIEQPGEGNIDHFLSGPTGVYTVETKPSHYRLAHLPQARRQAARLGAELGVRVTPVICLHRRKGRWAPFEASGVWIVPHDALRDWILGQRNRVAPSERVLRFVNGLLIGAARAA